MPVPERAIAAIDDASITAFCCKQLGIAAAEAAVIAELISSQARAASLVEQQGVTYLPLPVLLSALATERAYHAALPHGRAIYRDEQWDVDAETGIRYRVPFPYTRDEVLEMVQEYVYPADRRLQLAMPLPWRVGLVVGYLSGLWVSQPDEATNGLAYLAALVSPLLPSGSATPVSAAAAGLSPEQRLAIARVNREAVLLGGDDDDYSRVFDRCARSRTVHK